MLVSPHGSFLLGAAGFLWTHAIVLIAWVFFRARSLGDALTIITGGRISAS
ncbi:MAG TPA: hypothetical protein VL996_05945 [Methylocella sp.]|nr:hypothetical protein [Methylocella sp.]